MSGAEPSSDPRPPWGWPGWALASAAFLIGFCNFPLQVLGTRFDHMPGDLIDTRLNMVVLEHGYRCLRGAEPSFWDLPVFYPVRGVTAWSDAHIGMLPLYAGLRVCGLSPERATQGWFLIPFVLNFAAAAWAARRLGLGYVGATVAAYVFAFGLPLVGQILHCQLFPRFLVPPAVVFAWEWLRAPRSHWRLAAVAGCVAGQTYISVYTGYFLCLLLTAGAVPALVAAGGRLPWRDLAWPGWRGWAARLGVAVAAAGVMYPLVSAHRRNGAERKPEEVWLLAPRRFAWITPPGVTSAHLDLLTYARTRAQPGIAEEELLFPGFLPLLGIAVGLPLLAYAARRRAGGGPVAALAVGAWASVLLVGLITRWDDGGSAWLYGELLAVPGATGIRAIGRVALVLLFPAGFAAGALVDLAARRAGRGPLAAVVALVALGCVTADQWLTPATGPRAGDWVWVRDPLATADARRERVAAAVRARPGATLVYAFPSGTPREDPRGWGWAALQIDVMRVAPEFGVPTVNGWSARWAEGWAKAPDWMPPRTYRSLMHWLTVRNHTPPEVLAGLVVLGEPEPDPDPAYADYDAAMRAKYPPVPLP